MTFVRGRHHALRWEDCGRKRRWGWERVSSSVWGKCEIFSQRPGGESGHPWIHTWSSGENRRPERESWGCQHMDGTSRAWARSPMEGVKLESKRRQDWACPPTLHGRPLGGSGEGGPKSAPVPKATRGKCAEDTVCPAGSDAAVGKEDEARATPAGLSCVTLKTSTRAVSVTQ